MKKDPLKKIADEIKEARLKQSLTVDQLARESRVAAHHILSIENNHRKIVIIYKNYLKKV